jgi:hypothetical protein
MMKKITAASMFFLVFLPFLSAAGDGPSGATPSAQTYGFKMYYLIMGETVKKHQDPDFGYVTVKAMPLKVKEFTFSAPGMDYTKTAVKKAAGTAIAGLPEHRKKNAVYVSREIFGYIKASITAKDDAFDPVDSSRTGLQTASELISSGAGTNYERCRLACAMLRYFSIPARISSWKDRYVVEYYIKPLEGGKFYPNWHIMDFTGAYDAEPDKTEPVSWYPVDSKELLAEEWKGETLSIRVAGVKNSYLGNNEAESMAIFSNIIEGKDPDYKGNTGLSNFYLIKEKDYELMLPPGADKAEVTFTMPLNEEEPFRTMNYYVKSSDPKMKVTPRRTRTYIKPPQKGMVYTLPVDFEIIK